MEQRKKEILEAIIKNYIETAEPVGSRTIARKYELGVSPATIRNEMSDLEELGFIEQPHTSSGRIPSDKGYRYYVDWLMDSYQMSQGEIEYVGKRYAEKVEQIEEIVERTGQLLSQVTNYVALVMGPQLKKNYIKDVRLMWLSPGRALMVVVFQGGMVQHRTIKIPEDIKLSDLERITNILNSKLEGHAIQQLKTEMFQEIYGDMVREKMVLQRIMGVLLNYSREQIHLDGTVNILNQPEFHDVDKLRLLLTSLEEKSMVKQLLTGHSGTGLAIKIGGENKQQGIDQCSIITATYHIDGEAAGTIGLLGPTRMTYSKAIALVQLVTGKLSLVLKDYY